MGKESSYLHSHSALEREVKFPKYRVLVDEKFKAMFNPLTARTLEYNKVRYLSVPIMEFVRNGGVFKNFLK